MKPPRIEIEIGKLKLIGFSTMDRAKVSDALQSELSRLIGERGMPARDMAQPRLNIGNFSTHKDSPAATIGRQVARAVHKGIAK